MIFCLMLTLKPFFPSDSRRTLQVVAGEKEREEARLNARRMELESLQQRLADHRERLNDLRIQKSALAEAKIKVFFFLFPSYLEGIY